MQIREADPVDSTRNRIPPDLFRAQPWRVHELAADFRVEDVWLLSTPGGPDDLPRLVAQMTSGKRDLPGVVRLLMALRWKLGAVVGWDRREKAVGGAIESLRTRLPDDLTARRGPDLATMPMTSVYQTDREWLAEMGNRTVHGLMHISWVPTVTGGYQGQMAVLTKPNGVLGAAYMGLIKPIRTAIVYPAMLRGFRRSWQDTQSAQ